MDVTTDIVGQLVHLVGVTRRQHGHTAKVASILSARTMHHVIIPCNVPDRVQFEFYRTDFMFSLQTH